MFSHRSIAAGCLFLAIILTLPSNTHAQSAGPNAVAVNSIAITVDTSKKGQITASGSFTTAKNVTLTKVTVYAYPQFGGILSAPISIGAGGINNQNLTWGPGTTNVRVYKGSYAIRADAEFSDGTKSSTGYAIQTTDGDLMPAGNLSLSWDAGFPKSTASKKITSQGSWSGNPSAAMNGYMTALPLTGGGQSNSVMTLGQLGGTKFWTAGDITVPAGGIMYSVVGQANDNGPNGGQTYGTPFSSLQVMP
jgi:hypothetical protein